MMKLNTSHALLKESIESYQEKVNELHKVIFERTGAGNDFMGWVDWAETYDKAEFERILQVAEKVKDKPDGNTWNVGIADPEGALPNGLALISSKGSFSFVTSGDYERFYIATDGNSYHHIIDPSTNYPATHYRSVTIFTEDSGVADCLSTTLFTLSIEDGKKVLEAYKKATGKKANAVWVMDPAKKQGDGKETNGYYVVASEGLKDIITY